MYSRNRESSLAQHNLFCFCSNHIEIGTSIANELIKNDINADRMRKALELVQSGEFLKAAYVARGHALYNEALSDVSLHVMPSVIIDEMLSFPETATILDVGCGTGLIGVACRSSGYNGKLIGIDLVDDMLDAIPSGIYDELIAADAFKWLASGSKKFDMIVSFGVLLTSTKTNRNK